MDWARNQSIGSTCTDLIHAGHFHREKLATLNELWDGEALQSILEWGTSPLMRDIETQKLSVRKWDDSPILGVTEFCWDVLDWVSFESPLPDSVVLDTVTTDICEGNADLIIWLIRTHPGLPKTFPDVYADMMGHLLCNEAVEDFRTLAEQYGISPTLLAALESDHPVSHRTPPDGTEYLAEILRIARDNQLGSTAKRA